MAELSQVEQIMRAKNVERQRSFSVVLSLEMVE